MLVIKDLKVKVQDKPILKGINLQVKPGEVHAIMGPNGSGKSTLANVLAGKHGYNIESGNIEFKNKDLIDMSPEIRAREGLFLSFQYPVEIPGVSNIYFLKASLNAILEHQGKKELDTVSFMKWIKEKAKLVKLDDSFIKRSVNEGFSGGEKKRNEIFQMAVLEPDLAILDETDSGLDVDALKTVSDGVNLLRSENRSIILITHYQRLLNHIVPDKVHILYDGKIVKTGDKELAKEIEQTGYSNLKIPT